LPRSARRRSRRPRPGTPSTPSAGYAAGVRPPGWPRNPAAAAAPEWATGSRSRCPPLVRGARVGPVAVLVGHPAVVLVVGVGRLVEGGEPTDLGVLHIVGDLVVPVQLEAAVGHRQ